MRTMQIEFMDEPSYEYDYQYKKGHSINSMKMYVFDRYFEDDEDIRNSPDQSSRHPLSSDASVTRSTKT